MKSTENTRALLRHIMMMRQQRKESPSLLSFSGRQTGLKEPDEAQQEALQMTETRIYIGLNDAQTRVQEFETEHYLELLKGVCRTYQVPFSVDIEDGGYYHEDGEYTEETSFVLVLIDAQKSVVKAIANDLCDLFQQESVLVTENRLDGYFISRDET